MAKIELSCGEAVVVTFKDTDGEITIGFSDEHHSVTCLDDADDVRASALNDRGGIVVYADMPDKQGREGVIYHEPFGPVVVKPADKYFSNQDVCLPLPPKPEPTGPKFVEVLSTHVHSVGTGVTLDYPLAEKLYELLIELKRQKLGDITKRLDPAQNMLDEIFAYRLREQEDDSERHVHSDEHRPFTGFKNVFAKTQTADEIGKKDDER